MRLSNPMELKEYMIICILKWGKGFVFYIDISKEQTWKTMPIKMEKEQQTPL
jgi:hypothetical protein